MKTKYTPGPWKLDLVGDGKRWILGNGQSSWGTEVGEVYRDDTDRDEAEANAKLIAAAPALLELLQQMLDVAENADETGYVTDVGFLNLDKLHEQARAAIQSATT